MHTLITARFSSTAAAYNAQKVLMDLPSQNLPDVADGLIVTADPNGTFRLAQVVNIWTTSRDTLSLIQLVRWTLFVQPLLGVVSGTAVNRLRDALGDFGIPADFASHLQTNLTQDQAGLIIMPRSENADDMAKALRAHSTDLEVAKLEGLYEDDLRGAFQAVLHLINDHHKPSRGTAP